MERVNKISVNIYVQLLAVCCMVLPIMATAQKADSSQTWQRTSIYVEYGGQGIYPSVSLDRLNRMDKKIKTSLTGGLAIVPISGLFVFATPASYNWIFGQKKHHLELGAGLTLMYMREGKIDAARGFRDENGVYKYERFTGHQNSFYSYFTPKMGYRFQKPAGGFFMRLNLTPHVAGINRYGNIRGKKGIQSNSSAAFTEYFSSVAYFGNRVLLKAGISFGWTLKK